MLFHSITFDPILIQFDCNSIQFISIILNLTCIPLATHPATLEWKSLTEDVAATYAAPCHQGEDWTTVVHELETRQRQAHAG